MTQPLFFFIFLSFNFYKKGYGLSNHQNKSAPRGIPCHKKSMGWNHQMKITPSTGSRSWILKIEETVTFFLSQAFHQTLVMQNQFSWINRKKIALFDQLLRSESFHAANKMMKETCFLFWLSADTQETHILYEQQQQPKKNDRKRDGRNVPLLRASLRDLK